jgi:hypothetical protein
MRAWEARSSRSGPLPPSRSGAVDDGDHDDDDDGDDDVVVVREKV